MTDFLTQEEVASRDKAVDDFEKEIASAELEGLATVSIPVAIARLVMDEIGRWKDCEERLEDVLSAAEDHRFD